MTEMQEYWCIVANIKKSIPYGTGGAESKSGLRKFKAGARVEIVGAYYGAGDAIIALGQHRHSGKFISCVIRPDAIESMRVKLIYRPLVIEFLKDFKPNGAAITTSKERSEELMAKIPSLAN